MRGVLEIGYDLGDSGEENTPVRPNPLISLFLLEIQCRIISLLQLVVRKTGWMGFPRTYVRVQGRAHLQENLQPRSSVRAQSGRVSTSFRVDDAKRLLLS